VAFAILFWPYVLMVRCVHCQLPSQMCRVFVDNKLQFAVTVYVDVSVTTRIENWLQHALYEGTRSCSSSSSSGSGSSSSCILQTW